MSQTTFKGPARFAVYGGLPGNVAVARVSGANTIADAKRIIEEDRKIHPGCDYSIWQAAWTKVEEIKQP